MQQGEQSRYLRRLHLRFVFRFGEQHLLQIRDFQHFLQVILRIFRNGQDFISS